MENPGASTTFGEAFLDLHHPSPPAPSCIHPEVPKNIVVFWIIRAQELRQFLPDFFGAGDEASFVRVQFESCRFKLGFEGLEGQKGFLGNIGWITALDIIRDIINPSL